MGEGGCGGESLETTTTRHTGTAKDRGPHDPLTVVHKHEQHQDDHGARHAHAPISPKEHVLDRGLSSRRSTALPSTWEGQGDHGHRGAAGTPQTRGHALAHSATPLPCMVNRRQRAGKGGGRAARGLGEGAARDTWAARTHLQPPGWALPGDSRRNPRPLAQRHSASKRHKCNWKTFVLQAEGSQHGVTGARGPGVAGRRPALTIFRWVPW
jgi:hypothetical protein